MNDDVRLGMQKQARLFTDRFHDFWVAMPRVGPVPWSYQACGANTGTRSASPAFQVVDGSGILPVLTPAVENSVTPSPNSRCRVTPPVPVSVGSARASALRSCPTARSIWAPATASSLLWVLARRTASCHERSMFLAVATGFSIGSSISGSLGSSGASAGGSAAGGAAAAGLGSGAGLGAGAGCALAAAVIRESVKQVRTERLEGMATG